MMPAEALSSERAGDRYGSMGLQLLGQADELAVWPLSLHKARFQVLHTAWIKG